MEDVSPEDLAMGLDAESSSAQPSQTESFQHIRLDLAGGIATLTLRRPPTNYMHPAMLEEMLRVLNDLAFNKDCRVLVFRGEGDYFSAGLSPEAMKDDLLFVTVDLFHKVLKQFFLINTVTLAVVQGPAYGAGSVLAGMADFVLAGPKAKFGHPEVKYGHFTPTAALLYGRTMSKPRAAYLLLSGDVIDARTAMAWGLATWAVPEDQLDDYAAKLADRLAGYSASVLEFGRKALMHTLFTDIDTMLQELEDLYLVQLASTEDAREGIQAWLEKRAPEWKHM